MIVEYSTRFPFVSEIEVEGGEGEWRKPLEKSRYSDVARFTIRVLPGVSRSKANKTVFITGQGGNLFDVYEALRCKTRGNNRRGVATCPNPCSEWWRCYLWGRVNDSTWRRFRWQLLKKKWDERGDFVGFVGDSVESLLYYYCNYLKTSLYSSL